MMFGPSLTRRVMLSLGVWFHEPLESVRLTVDDDGHWLVGGQVFGNRLAVLRNECEVCVAEPLDLCHVLFLRLR